MRARAIKNLCWILFLIIPCIASSQTVIHINSCDTTFTDPSTVLSPNTHYAISVHAPAGNQLSFNVEYYSANYGDIAIFNGPTTSAELMTHLGDPFDYPNQKFGGQTTANNITLLLNTTAVGGPLHFRIRVRCVQQPGNYPLMQPMQQLGWSGNIKVADYDNDGDKDLLIGGKVYRNDSFKDSLFRFERRLKVLDGWSKVNMCAADFDNDGDLDVFVTGTTSSFNSGANLYKNNGDGTFTLTSTPFAGATRGGCSIVDFNGDGKPDICYTGSAQIFQNNTLIFKIYLNQGNMVFSDANIALPDVTGLVNSTMSWADCDGDGDKDLLINGHNGFGNVAGVYLNNNNSFTKLSLWMTPTSQGNISWVDINMDGKPDIFNAGVSSIDNVNGIVPELYINNGGNNFTYLTTNLPALVSGGTDWFDYDGDHDMDVAMNGVIVPWGNGVDAGVYKYNGNGQFARVSNLAGAKAATMLKWYDFNHDGKMDIIGSNGYYIKNMGADSFRIASLKATTTEYNSLQNALLGDFNGDGQPDILLAGGGFSDVDCTSNASSVLVAGIGWQPSAVPVFTQTADINAILPVIANNGYNAILYYQWGDFDSDGKQDILITGDNPSHTNARFLIVFKNYGDDVFNLIFNSQQTPLPAPPQAFYANTYPVGLFDIDNDGVNELFLSPNTVYKKNGSQWTILYNESSNTVGGGLSMDFADYDKDGFTDVVVSNASYLTVFRNNGAGKMVNIVEPWQGYTFGAVGSGSVRQVQWADMNNDGWPDIVTSDGVYFNKAGTGFSGVSSQNTPFVHAGIGDLNNDGFKDLVIVPYLPSTGSGPLEIYYSKQGTGFYDKQSMGDLARVNQASFNETAVCFDVDGDGDDDIVFSGGGGCNIGAAVIINQGTPVFTPLMPGYFTVADGNWSDPMIWINHIVPPANADVTIVTNVTADINVTCNSLFVDPPGKLTVNSRVQVKILH